jgi:hypothetical protein
MEFTTRTQIVPLGYEYNRVLKPIYEFKADKVVLLRQPEEKDFEAEFQRDLVQELEDNERIELEICYCDLFDINNAIEAFVNAIASCESDEILVNVSTGSKITAIAGMIACQSTAAKPFYVSAQFRNEDGELEAPETPQVESIGEISELPVFNIQGPNPDQLVILQYLRQNDGATKKELIEHAREQELDFIANSKSKSEEGLYQLLGTNVISPLSEKKYVRVVKEGRKKRVYLEEHGQEALVTFPQSVREK